MTERDLDRMAAALGLDDRLAAARHFCASLVTDMEDLAAANKRLSVERDEARAVAHALWDLRSPEDADWPDLYALREQHPWLKETA